MQKSESLGICFYNEEHQESFFELLNRMKKNRNDSYHLSAAYLMSLDRVCRQHVDDIFDFKEDLIKPEGLYKAWQTGTSRRTTRLMYNLWNDYCYDGEIPKEDSKPSIYCIPGHIFACSYAFYYFEAIKLRFPDYCG